MALIKPPHGAVSLHIDESGSNPQESPAPITGQQLKKPSTSPEIFLKLLSVRKKSTAQINRALLTDDEEEPSPGPRTRSNTRKTGSPKTAVETNETKRKKTEDRWRAIDYSSDNELHTKINSYVNWLTKSGSLIVEKDEQNI